MRGKGLPAYGAFCREMCVRLDFAALDLLTIALSMGMDLYDGGKDVETKFKKTIDKLLSLCYYI